MKITRSISLAPYPPRVRRVSRYELQKLFPNYRSNRVSSQESFNINLQSSQHQHQLVQVAPHQQRVVVAAQVPHLQPVQRVLQRLRQPRLQQKQLQHQVQVVHHRRVQVCS
ncbi:unnamed protein product [Rotaria magnacalcarata]|uniref:Uncharacterized protein n=1 Tax=Rotaria magnacalcarata TaxID=392030 RepID=A0A815WAT7_9BILA|nr:unnamed protein product [Rotaria magnacalcarata]